MPAGSRPETAGIALGEVLREAIRGIRNEILLYGVFVISVLFLSGWYGVDVLRELKYPILGFATLVLVVYFIVVLINLWKEGQVPGRPRSRQQG
ncbi:MAG TPA: hypothetical protein VMB35_06235 [Methanomicrobiales archaeon]|nr:hypothetical protein [Methanomicrobiales archaeon]